MPPTAVLHTLHLTLAPSDAVGTSWHAGLTSSDTRAAIGSITLGPTAFAHRLATLVGHPLHVALTAERVAAADSILAALDDDERWYSRTRTSDPVGAAQWLVSSHDTLRMAGWDGRPLTGSPRLASIAALRAGTEDLTLPPGLPDALHGLVDTLHRRPPSVPVHVHLLAQRSAYTTVVQRLFAALESQGATVSEAIIDSASAPADCDLGRLQRALLGAKEATFTNDGTVTILQGDSPWEASALATALRDDTEMWLVSGESALLDRVRERFDRPLLGGGSASCWRPALQILPLLLALQTGPQDPNTALELLTLPVSPVPRRIRRALIGALGKQPAVGSPAWSDALCQGLSEHVQTYPDVDAKALQRRLDTLFPVMPPSTITVGELVQVVELIARWAATAGASADDVVLLAAASVASDLARSLRRMPHARELDRLQIAQLHGLALGSGVTTGSTAEAGAPAVVRSPACVPVDVSKLVWFGLVAGNAEVGREIVWTTAERADLVTAGVSLSGPGARRAQEQSDWQRAVLAPNASLTLVTWTSAGGAACEPHPMIDLWATHVHDGALQQITLTASQLLSKPDVLVAAIKPTPGVHPVSAWRVPAGLISTDRRWSASGIEALITCPMQWTFRYAAGLKPGDTAALPSVRAMAGTFGHALFERVLFEDEADWHVLTAETAKQQLWAAFDARVGTEAAPLTLPHLTAFSGRLRRQLGEAMASVVTQLKAGGWRPIAAEQDVGDLNMRLADRPLRGSIDLVVAHADGRRAVIDLKLGGGAYQSEKLRAGKSIQLAVYAKALGGGTTPLPPVAYFILETGEMITTDESAFPLATHVHGPGPGETWLDTMRAWEWWSGTVRDGLVVTRGGHVAERLQGEDLAQAAGSEPPDHPWAEAEPSCHFCDAQRLCTFVREGGVR